MKIFSRKNTGYTRTHTFLMWRSHAQSASKKYVCGYTIIETMIAVSLFITITMVGMTSLLNANLVHKKSENMRSIIDNLNFVMEDMSKNMRTGFKFRCFRSGDPLDQGQVAQNPRSCSTGWAISFESALGNPSSFSDQWVYYIDSTKKIFKSTDGANTFFQITPDEVIIDTTASTFSVLGAEPMPGDTQQPLINIRLVGKITYKTVDTPFSLQTAVSSRYIDVAN